MLTLRPGKLVFLAAMLRRGPVKDWERFGQTGVGLDGLVTSGEGSMLILFTEEER